MRSENANSINQWFGQMVDPANNEFDQQEEIQIESTVAPTERRGVVL